MTRKPKQSIPLRKGAWLQAKGLRNAFLIEDIFSGNRACNGNDVGADQWLARPVKQNLAKEDPLD